jgi:hypothetical protein
MRKLFPLITALVLAVTFSSCIRNDGPQPNYPRERYFVDEFQDDRNSWTFADPANYAYGVVQDGVFKFDYNDDLSEAYYVSKNIYFNRFNDFTIHTRIGSNNNMGLLFGYGGGGIYGYSFMVDRDGYFALYDEGGNGYGPDVQTLVNRSTANFINPNGDWNDLRLEQRGGRWLGFINNNLVFNIEAQNLRGTNVGFVNVAFTQGDADYLQVDWLE